MRNRNWKRAQPNSISHAMQLCVDYAKEKKNLSVDRISDLMTLSGASILYKWIGTGKMPAAYILSFEHACGINFVSRYLAHSAGSLILPIPTGRKTTHKKISAINLAMSETGALLLRYQDGEIDANEAITSITDVMEGLAYHRGNISKQQQPELELH